MIIIPKKIIKEIILIFNINLKNIHALNQVEKYHALWAQLFKE
jgi:hypothetical protein